MRTALFHFILTFFLVEPTLAQTVERGPYLQVLTPNSVVIKWRTSTSTNSRISYGTSLNQLNGVASASGSTINHEVQVSNLTPNTLYYYMIGTATQVLAGPNEHLSFKTSPDPGMAQPMRFWIIGDFGKGNPEQSQVASAYLNYTGSTRTDGWIWLGDNAYNDGTDAEYQQKVFDIYEPLNIMSKFPLWPCPGNHDYGSINRLSSPPQHTGPYFDLVTVPTNGEAGGVPSGYEHFYSFDYGNAHFVSLNSEIEEWTGAFSIGSFSGSPMLTWLENDLQQTDKKWKIVFWHQTPYSRGSHDSDDLWEVFMAAMRTHFVPVLDDHGVDLVLCGHSHVYERSHLIAGHYGTTLLWDENLMLVDGSSGNELIGEAYVKPTYGPEADRGIVFANVGNSGSHDDDAALDHPVMAAGDGGPDGYGSLMIDIDGNKLNGTYLNYNGVVEDQFTIIKQDECQPVIGAEAFDVQSSSAKLRWDCVAGAHGYVLRGNKVGQPGFVELNLPPGCPGFKKVTGLQPNSTYWWQVKTLCNAGGTQFSDWSSRREFTTTCRPPEPITTTSISSTSAVLNWTAVNGNDGYEIRGRQIGSSNWVTLNRNGGSSFTANGLRPGRQYEWQIRTNCGDGVYSEYTDLIDFSTAGSGARRGSSQNEPQFDIFPNPTNGKFSIKSGTSGMIEIHNTKNKLVERRKIQQGESIQFLLHEHDIYFITLIEREHRSIKKLVVSD